MRVKTTILYKNQTILDQFVELTSSISVLYKSTTVGTLVGGDIRRLNTKNKSLSDYIQIGSKRLNTKGKDLDDYITIIVETAWEDPIQTGDNITATQAYQTTQIGPYLEVL